MGEFVLYNTLSRKKEVFEPLHKDFVGMYVCGPTVYGDPHLGHARPAICFDILFRYLKKLGYKTRYVRNITDVGHLEHDADEGEDKIAKKARLEQLEPMEVAQYYTNRYRKYMDILGVEKPSIEPQASAHIMEQIAMIESIIEKGYAYIVNGSVYFDVNKYNADKAYGILSGRLIEDLISTSRDNLASQDEKRSAVDFALWKKASKEHIMRWPSPWSEGFPGWHAECSAMSNKYLGNPFDIHGGGLDLLFPHHEAEIAQSCTAYGSSPCKYWVHNNMITINGQKMGKSLGNFITLEEVFTGSHKLLEQAYSPMTIRFFILQAHYRSTLDFSNEALQAAEKAYKRLVQGYKSLEKLKAAENGEEEVSSTLQKISSAARAAMNDDLNTPIVIAQFFELLKLINLATESKLKFSAKDIEDAKDLYLYYFVDVMGLELNSQESGAAEDRTAALMEMLLEFRNQAKKEKNFALSDKIRDNLKEIGIKVLDSKEGATWQYE